MTARAVVLQRLQPHWDWRAAGNFICGGAGAGLLLFVLVAGVDFDLRLPLVACGLALVGMGLFCVWLEIGRPWRAFNVFAHLTKSWMSREALAAVLLFLLGGGLLLGMSWRAWPTVVAAGLFLYCQARILGAARAIPAWRDLLSVPLLIVTGLTEGAGLFWLLAGWTQPAVELAVPLVVLLVARAVLWTLWRRRLATRAPVATLRAIDRQGRWLKGFGTTLPLVLAAVGWFVPSVQGLALAFAGAFAVLAGASFKFDLITRAGHHGGIVLPRMPVRGVPR